MNKNNSLSFSINLPNLAVFDTTTGSSSGRTRGGSVAKAWSLLFLLLFMGLTSLVEAQITPVTYDFNANSTGWTGNITRTTATSACGSASMRRNLYASATTGNMVSPQLAGTNWGGEVTISYKYKAANWSANTVGTNPWGSFNVQWGPSATGPWTTFATVSQETQTGTCITKTHTFTPAAGNLFIKWDCFWSAGDYYINFDDITLSQLPPPSCSGTPATAVASITAGSCTYSTQNLSATGFATDGGITYQWQSSTDGVNFSNIAGATSTSYSTAGLTATYYQLVTTCTSSGLTSTSNIVSYTPGATAALPWSEGFESITTYGSAAANLPSCWTSQSTQWTSSNATTYNNAHGGTDYIRYAWSTTNAFMWTPGFNLTAGTTYEFSFWAQGDGGTGWTNDVFVNTIPSSTGATQFGSTYVPAGTGTYAIQPYALVTNTYTPTVSGTYFFAVRGNQPSGAPWYMAFDDFGLVEFTGCSGAPSGGITSASAAAVCSGTTVNFTNAGYSVGGGITYQWEYSADGTNFSAIAGATNGAAYSAAITAAGYYRLAVTCANSNTTSYSNNVQVTLNAPLACYCQPTTTYGCTDGDVIARVILNTLDNNSGTGCPSGTAGYSNYTTDPALTTTLLPSTTYSCVVYAGQYAQGYAAWIDYNDNGVFETTERIGYSNGTVAGSGQVGVLGSSAAFPVVIDCNPPVGTHRMRVRGMYATQGINVTPCTNNFYGEIEDYNITIAAPPVCPSPGSLTVSATTYNSVSLTWPLGCSTATNYDFEYGPTGFTPGTGTLLTNVAATIDGATNTGSYTITGLAANTTYQVYYRANCGAETSAWSFQETFLTSGLPTIFASQNPVCVGSTFILTVENVFNSPDATYQWYSSNDSLIFFPINNATNDTLLIDISVLTTFYCAFSTLGNTINSTPLTINVFTPTIFSNLQTEYVYCQNETAAPLCVTYANGPMEVNYQWFNNSINSNSGGVVIPGATSSCYTPSSEILGADYYYVSIDFPGSGCSSILSMSSEVDIVSAPIISSQPISSQTICLGEIPSTLTIAVQDTFSIGNISCQWYSNNYPTYSGATVIPNATNTNFTPPTFSQTGSYYYYCVLIDSTNLCGEAISQISQCNVLSPVAGINISPTQQGICVNASLSAMSVFYCSSVIGDSYQWYFNTTGLNSGGILVPGATQSSYTPPNNSVFGTRYYYCAITDVDTGLVTNSPVSQVTISAVPSFSSQPLSTQTLCLDGIATTLSVVTTNGSGTPTYQWYSNTVNSNSSGTPILNETNSSYTPPSSTIGTRYYYCIASYSASACGSITSNVATVNVVADPVLSTQLTSSQTICSGGSPSALSVVVTGGNGTTSYQWYNGLTTQIIAGQTSSSYSPGVQTAVGDYTYYVVVTQTGNGCNSLTSNTSTVSVIADPIASIAPLHQGICLNGSLTPLNVTYTGGEGVASFQWYYNYSSENFGGGFLSGAIQSSYLPSSSLSRNYYCVITLSGSGCSVNSPVSQVTISAVPSFSSQPLSTQTLCLDGIATTLSVVTTNGSGTPTYQWYSNTVNSNSSGTPILNETNSSYTPPSNTIGTRYYYCIASYSASACGSITSNVATVNVVADPVLSTQPNSFQTICSGGSPSALSVVVTGGNGTTSYQWYNGLTTQIIAGQTSSSYSPGVQTTLGDYTYYVVATQTGNGCNSLTSNTSTVSVIADPIASITPLQQGLCVNGVLTPLSVSYTGGTGTASYQWYYNTTNSNTGGTLVSGATSATYSPPNNVVFNRYYYCVITLNGSGCSVNSPVSQVTISAVPSFSSQPLSTQTLCLDGTPTTLSVVTTNGSGTPTYQWYSNTVNSNISGTLILNETNSSYTPPSNTIGIRYYYCIASYSASACGSITSNVATVNVVADPSQSVQPILNQMICQGGNGSLSVAATGGTGFFSYQWYDLNSGFPIPGAISATFNTGALSAEGNYSYYCFISQSGSGCDVIISNPGSVSVLLDPIASITPLQQGLCVNGVLTPLSVSYTGGTGTATYQWYYNTTNLNTGGTLVSGATSATYSPPTTAAFNRYYYCVITLSGSGCSVNSPVSQVTISAVPSFSSQPLSTQTLCLDGTPTTLSVVTTNGSGPPTYQWYSNTVNSNSSGTPILNETNSSYTPPSNTIGTRYYYCIASYSASACGSITSNVATVNVVADPVLSTQPTSFQTICVGGTSGILSVAVSGGNGTTSYQWYNATTNAAISGQTTSSYSPGVFNSVGDNSYYVVASQTGNGCNVITSNTSLISVIADPVATITPLQQGICVGGTLTPLSVSYTGGVGTPSYQWYYTLNGANSGGTIISASGATYPPNTSVVSNYYYYCAITLGGAGCSANTPVSQVSVNNTPSFSTQPLSTQTLCLDGTPTTLSVVTSNGYGIPSYQWYSNTINSTAGGTAISGETTSSYVPPSNSLGTRYYYCIASYSASACGSITSNIATVNVVADPIISVQPLSSQTICVGGMPSISLVASGGTGNFTYQWYNVDTGLPISGATGASAALSYALFSNIGTSSFNCIVSQNGSGCNPITSINSVVFTVNDPVATISPVQQGICVNGTLTPLNVNYTGGVGTASYLWYYEGNILAVSNGNPYSPPTGMAFNRNYYCVITLSGSGCSVNSPVSQVTISAVPSFSSQPLSTQTLCLDGIATTLSVVTTNGSGTPTYQWYSNTVNSNSSGTPILNETNSSYTPPSSTIGTRYYYCIASYSASACGSITSNVATVNVVADPVLSTQLTSSQTICSGGSPSALSVVVTGGNGTTSYQWYNGLTTQIIAGQTSSSYSPGVQTAVGDYTYYVVVTQTGNGCNSLTSNTSTVSVIADPIASITPLQQGLCVNGVLTPLSVSYTGGTGTASYQWYYNTTNSNTGGTLVSGATSATYSPPTTAAFNRYYYCVITLSGSGCSVNSPVSQATVYATPVITVQPNALNTVCQGGNGNLQVTSSNGVNIDTYQWYTNSTNSNIGGTPIIGLNSNIFTNVFPNVGTFYFYAVVCGNVVSNVATVNVVADPVLSTQLTSSQTICSGGSPSALSVVVTGGNGTTSYQWYNGLTNQLIAGQTSSSYSPWVQTAVGDYTYYVVATQTGNGCNSLTSNTSTVSVIADPIASITPLQQGLCVNGVLTPLSVSYTGGTGTATYQWYYNTTNSNTGGTLVSGATSATYSPPTTAAFNRYYYCVITLSGSGCSVNSPVSQLTISAVPSFSSQPLSTQTLCLDGTATTLSVVTTNGSGTPTYQWYSNTVNSNSSGTPILNETNSSYTPPSNTIGTRYYYCIASYSASACGSITSNVATVNVVADPSIITQPTLNQTYCVGGTPSPLAISVGEGTGTFNYQWYDGITNSAITGQTFASYTPVEITGAGIYEFYVIVTQTGNGCNALISDEIMITVMEDPVVSMNYPSYQIVCLDTELADIEVTVSGGAQISYQWYVSSVPNFEGVPIPNNNMSIYTPPTDIIGASYYYCVVSSFASGCGIPITSPFVQVLTIDQPQIISNSFNVGACIGNSIPELLCFGNLDSLAEIHFFQSNTINSYDGSELSSTNFAPSSSDLGNYSYFFTYNVDYPGCFADTSDFYNVSITDIPTLTLGSNESLVGCVGAEIELTNFVQPNLNSDYILVWNLDNSLSDTTYSNNVFSTLPIESAGIHAMQVQIQSTLDYCSATDNLNLSIDIVPNPSITEEQNFIQTLCPFDEEIEAPTVLVDFDNPIGPPTYSWNQVEQGGIMPIANSNQNSYLPQLPLHGIFNSQCVISFDYPGCNVLTTSLSTLTFDDNNLDCFPELVIPEAISPNNDGMNDYWTIPGIEQFNGYEINIFNSFGQSIYFVKNTPPNWDGMWNGQILPNGDYFYSVKLNELNRIIFGTLSLNWN